MVQQIRRTSGVVGSCGDPSQMVLKVCWVGGYVPVTPHRTVGIRCRLNIFVCTWRTIVSVSSPYICLERGSVFLRLSNLLASTMLTLLISCLVCFALVLRTTSASSCNTTDLKPRIFVCTDISNEPDDQESLVRLLVHADQYVVEGLVATTSFWLNDTTYPDHILQVIDAYANVTTNLNAHTDTQFPSADYLRSKVKSSHEVYGLAALQNRTLSSGAALLITAVDASSQPLYVQLWAGATVLAETLRYVEVTRSRAALAMFIARLRVYSISDQDDAGVWIRGNYPKVRYIASIHGFNMYGLATWVGISAESSNYFDHGGPNSSLVSSTYIKQNFQRGQLGAKYPDVEFIMEGDTPSLLYTMQNGLNVPEHPEYGSWGGRYTLVDLSGRSQHYSDTADFAIGVNNQTYRSNQATIWRWRSAYQNEMAARIHWSVSANYSAAVHPPRVDVNGSCGYAPLELDITAGQEVVLDAGESFNPDTNGTADLSFEWIHYRDITNADAMPNWAVANLVPLLNFTCLDDGCTSVSTLMPEAARACGTNANLKTGCQSYHIILSVTNGGNTPMTRYKRVIIDITEPTNSTMV